MFKSVDYIINSKEQVPNLTTTTIYVLEIRFRSKHSSSRRIYTVERNVKYEVQCMRKKFKQQLTSHK